MCFSLVLSAVERWEGKVGVKIRYVMPPVLKNLLPLRNLMLWVVLDEERMDVLALDPYFGKYGGPPHRRLVGCV